MGLLGTVALLLCLILVILLQTAVFFEVGELRRSMREFLDREGGGRRG